MATDSTQGRTPTTAEQMEASNAMMHAQSAVQAAEAKLRAATKAVERTEAQKAVQAAGAEMDKVKQKFGWIFDWQKASRDVQSAANTTLGTLGGAAGSGAASTLGAAAAGTQKMTVAQAEAMLRDAKTAEERVKAQNALREATTEAQKSAGTLSAGAAQLKKHVVQKGESLSLIAKHYTGDAQKWKELYEANKATVGKNPNIIQPGMELVLPW